MNNQSKKNERLEMNDKAEDFRELYGKYLSGKIKEEELADITTQPFWQSMHVSKRRLDKLGLKMNVIFDSDNKDKAVNNISVFNGGVNLTEDGNNLTGCSNLEVKTRREIFRGNKKIFTRYNREILHTHLIKSNITGDMAACPNCGHIGKISSYIDGCDFCGAKYVVSDFNTKISGFSLEDNIGKKFISTYKNAFRTILLLSLIVFLVGFFSFNGLFSMFGQQMNINNVLKSLLPGFFALAFLPALIKSIFIFAWVFIVIIFIANMFYKKDIIGSDKVAGVIDNFSAVDFAQSIELELKNIHFSESEKEVFTFMSCNPEELIKKYKNVVDCNLIRIKFIKASEIKSNSIDERMGKSYLIDAEITMRVFYDTGKRIKSKNEKVICTFSGNDAVISNPTYVLREYKCSHCGSSINVMDGGICDNCGGKLDYSRIGWIIKKYESRFEISNVYKNMHIIIVALFIGILSVSLEITNTEDDYNNINNFNLLYSVSMYSEELLDITLGMVPAPDEMDASISQVQCVTSYSKRYMEYEADYFKYRQYIDFLKSNGYMLYDKEISIEENSEAYQKFKGNTVEAFENSVYIKNFNSSEVIDYVEHHTTNKGVINLVKYEGEESSDGYILVKISYDNSRIHILISLDEE